MKVKGGFGDGFSGRLGNLIFYERGGRTFARRVAIPGKTRKWETEGRTERQQAAANRFRVVQRLYAYYRKAISPDIWAAAAREEGRMAHALFHSANHGCFDGEGRLVKPELLRFSAGRLLLPPGLRVSAMGGGVFRAEWDDEEERETCAATDRLRAGVVYASTSPSMYWALEAEGTRGDRSGTFRLRADLGPEAHAYLFFERADGSAYSPSAHFGVDPTDGADAP